MATSSVALDQVREQLWQQAEFSFIPDRMQRRLDGPVQKGGGPGVLFAGFPSDYSLAFLLGLLTLDIELIGVVTSPGAHPAILGSNALSCITDHLEIPLIRAWRVNDEHTRLDLAALSPAAVVMASFDQIIGGRALAIPAHGWMNVHPSALPARRGPEPVYWTIADGDAVAGITLHRAVPKVDAGPILAQRHVDVSDDDTAGTLTRRLCAAGLEALPRALDRLLSDDAGDPIDLSGATYAPSVGHRRLDGAPSVAAALRWVRAGAPNMPAWTVLEGATTYVRVARPANAGDRFPRLRLPDGDIELVETRKECGCHHNLIACPHRLD